MRIGFVINSIATEKSEYTTVRLALDAARKGHDTWMMGVDDFSHRADDTVAIRPVKVAQITDGEALIDSGLKAGEQVVVDGQYRLQPGTHVTQLHGEAAEEAAAQQAQQAVIP